MNTQRIAGVELGGTKASALVAELPPSEGAPQIIAEHTIPTTSPEETLGALAAWLAAQHAHAPLQALGIASFGPLSLDTTRYDYGCITSTPKPLWSHADVIHGLGAAQLGVPMGFDTDVNGAALAEGIWGAAKACGVHVYLTIGTGLGGGLVMHGAPVHGLVHPEMGHARVRRCAGDTFAGVCPFHGDCLEGLVAGPALAARTGLKGEAITADNDVWEKVAQELGDFLANLILIVSAEKILIGGGVGMGQPHLFPLLRDSVAARLNGYVAGLDRAKLETLIAPPALGEEAGKLGAIALGLRAYESAHS
jgi:fructokinase